MQKSRLKIEINIFTNLLSSFIYSHRQPIIYNFFNPITIIRTVIYYSSENEGQKRLVTGEKNIGEKHTSELVCVIIDEVFLPPKWFRRKMKKELEKNTLAS